MFHDVPGFPKSTHDYRVTLFSEGVCVSTVMGGSANSRVVMIVHDLSKSSQTSSVHTALTSVEAVALVDPCYWCLS